MDQDLGGLYSQVVIDVGSTAEDLERLRQSLQSAAEQADAARSAASQASAATQQLGNSAATASTQVAGAASSMRNAATAATSMGSSAASVSSVFSGLGGVVNASSYKLQQFVYLVDDLQYVGTQGLRPVINNFMMIHWSLGLVALAAQAAWPHVKGLVDSMSSDEVKKFSDAISALKERIDELEKMGPTRLAVDDHELDVAKEKLEKLVKAKAAFDASMGLRSQAERDSGALVKNVLAEAEGGAAASVKAMESRQIREGERLSPELAEAARTIAEKAVEKRRAEAAAEAADSVGDASLAFTERHRAASADAAIEAAQENARKARAAIRKNAQTTVGGLLQGAEQGDAHQQELLAREIVASARTKAEQEKAAVLAAQIRNSSPAMVEKANEADAVFEKFDESNQWAKHQRMERQRVARKEQQARLWQQGQDVRMLREKRQSEEREAKHAETVREREIGQTAHQFGHAMQDDLARAVAEHVARGEGTDAIAQALLPQIRTRLETGNAPAGIRPEVGGQILADAIKGVNAQIAAVGGDRAHAAAVVAEQQRDKVARRADAEALRDQREDLVGAGMLPNPHFALQQQAARAMSRAEQGAVSDEAFARFVGEGASHLEAVSMTKRTLHLMNQGINMQAAMTQSMGEMRALLGQVENNMNRMQNQGRRNNQRRNNQNHGGRVM